MIIDFTERHRAKAITEIAERINTDWDAMGEPYNEAWDRAVKKYAAEIYADRMSRREAQS